LPHGTSQAMVGHTKFHTMARNRLLKAWLSLTSRRCVAEFDGCSDDKLGPLYLIEQQLMTLQAASIDHTTDIRLQAGDREAQRRVAEERRRQDRLWRLQEEAVASNKANAAVEMKWSELKYHNMPQELNEVCGRVGIYFFPAVNDFFRAGA